MQSKSNGLIISESDMLRFLGIILIVVKLEMVGFELSMPKGFECSMNTAELSKLALHPSPTTRGKTGMANSAQR